jgi:hypothetical protein
MASSFTLHIIPGSILKPSTLPPRPTHTAAHDYTGAEPNGYDSYGQVLTFSKSQQPTTTAMTMLGKWGKKIYKILLVFLRYLSQSCNNSPSLLVLTTNHFYSALDPTDQD